MRRLTPFIKLVVASTVCFLFLVGGVSVAILTLGSVRSSWQVLGQAHAELAALEHIRARTAANFEELETLRLEMASIESVYVNSENPLPFIEAIESLGTRTGVKVELSIAQGAGGEGENYRLSAAGSFHSTMTFFKTLESLPFIVEFGDISLRRTDGSVSSGSAEKISGTATRLELAIHPFRP